MARRLVLATVLFVLIAQPAAGTVATDASAGAQLERGGPSAAAAATDDGAVSATSDGDIIRRMTFALTPSEPGTVRVTLAYEIPDSVVELRTSVPSTATVRQTEDFESDGTGNYTWTGDGGAGSITFDLPANRSGEYQYDRETDRAASWPEPGVVSEPTGARAASTAGSGLLFADTGPWALVSVPPISVSWSYRGQPAPQLVRQVRAAGEGVAGSRMVYLGPHTSTRRTIDGQEVTLVVPEDASLEPDADAVLSSIGAASASLQIGAKPERMVLIAAPTSVDWGPFGLAQGTDAWVRADQSLDDANNVWLHEYVHVRQDFRTTADARWTREAMGEYYAAALTLEQGRIGFDAFREHLARGADQRYDETVLSRPETWASLANYVTGALVFGDLDRRMRVATDGSEPASHLVRAMNRREGPVDDAFLDETIASLAGDSAAATFERYATTTTRPEMWTRSDHQAAFSTLPPRIVAGGERAYYTSGPYRNRTVDEIPVLVPGERLSISVLLANEGDARGEFRRELLVEGEQVAVAEGELAGGANTTVTLNHTFGTPGTYGLRLDGMNWTVAVAEPRVPTVSAIDVPRREVETGASVTVTVTLANPGARPAGGNLSLLVEGESRTSWTVRLDAGATVTRTAELTFDSPGEHVIQVGNQTATITVAAPSTTASTSSSPTSGDGTQTGGTQTDADASPTGTSVPTPGFGPLSIVGVLVLLAARAVSSDR